MRKRMVRAGWTFLSASAIVLSSGAGALAAELPMDSSFSNDGRTFVATYGSFASDVVARSGQIYSIGRDFHDDGSRPLTFVARTNSDGTPDRNFGDEGLQFITPRHGGCFWSGLTLDSADRVMGVTACERGLTVFRLTTAGAIDTTFSHDGVRALVAGQESGVKSPQIAVDGNGRVVVASEVDSGGASDTRVWRLTTTGAADLSFSGDGTRVLHRPGIDWLDAMTLDDEDRILVAQGPKARGSYLYRLTTRGRLDTTFSNAGVKRVHSGAKGAEVLALESGADGRLTMAIGIGRSQGAMRLRASGAVDGAYGNHGVIRVTCDCYASTGDVVNGRVLVSGSLAQGDRWLTRFSSDGTHIRVASGNLYPDRRGEGVLAVALSGRKALVAGQARITAFVARVE